jgi:hypothetical protein
MISSDLTVPFAEIIAKQLGVDWIKFNHDRCMTKGEPDLITESSEIKGDGTLVKKTEEKFWCVEAQWKVKEKVYRAAIPVKVKEKKSYKPIGLFSHNTIYSHENDESEMLNELAKLVIPTLDKDYKIEE